MWGYEGHFQSGLTVEAQQLFAKLDPDLAPEVFLVGILDENRPKQHPVCVVPDDGPYPAAVFAGVKQTAASLRESDPENAFDHSHPIAADRATERIRRRGFAKATRQAVENAASLNDVRTFCSWPVPVAGYLVLVVLQLARAPFDRYHRLHREFVQDGGLPTYIARSFLDAAAEAFLSAAADHLQRPDPGVGFRVIADRDQVLRDAARELMYNPGHFGGNEHGLHGLYEVCTTLSTLRYEGKPGVGAIVFAPPDHPDIETVLAFAAPVPLREYGAVRKLLEMTTAGVSLLADSLQVYGLGRVRESYDPGREDVFTVQIDRQFCWELRHADRTMMYVRYGTPCVRVPGFPGDRFRTDLPRVCPGVQSRDIQRLAHLAAAAARQRHGCTLVISATAAAEAERLARQGTRTTPFPLTDALLPLVTSIDGAVLVDTQGSCHAVGVILDGLASPRCTPSRGSRYNSAVRYVEHRGDCVAVVKSEDGTVSVLPELKPQLRRRELDDAFRRLRELAEAHEVRLKDFYAAMDRLTRHAFYLSGEQCDEANALRAKAERRIAGGSMRVFRDFQPDPGMNASYLLD